MVAVYKSGKADKRLEVQGLLKGLKKNSRGDLLYIVEVDGVDHEFNIMDYDLVEAPEAP